MKLTAQKAGLLIALLSSLYFAFATKSFADTIFYTTDSFQYSPSTTDIINNAINFETTQVVSNPSNINYDLSSIQYSPANSGVSATHINSVASQVAPTFSRVNYNPQTSNFSSVRNTVGTSVSTSNSYNLASVASSVKYTKTTTQLPTVKRTVVKKTGFTIKQTASVADAIKLPKTGGGGRAMLRASQNATIASI